MFRPKFHFSPEKNWMNDPNGLFFFEGKYHLFYQYNPYGNDWGHMSWGHAVSIDLINWKELPVALEEEDDIMIFSGCAVVDWKNTSGFGINNIPPIIAIYTGRRSTDIRQFQCLAYSNDKGYNWSKYQKNPILDIESENFRDPKVFWYQPNECWIMIVALSIERKVQLYESANLIDWKFLSDFGPSGSIQGIWECPDLFPLRVDGDSTNIKWILAIDVGSHSIAGGSGAQYFIGEFNGLQFTEEKIEKTNSEVLADFGGADYQGWKVRGDAFGDGPAQGTLINKHPISGYLGKGLVNSFLNGDESTGSLISPKFVINKPFINFLIAGGKQDDQSCVKLVVDDRVARLTTGDESEILKWHYWNVIDLIGKTAEIQIIDAHKEGWRHINVDHIIFSEQPEVPGSEPANWVDYGRDFYAAVTYSDIPTEDGRRIWIGWMNNWDYAKHGPTHPWRGSMSLPRSLELKNTPDGLRLFQQPVKEVDVLRDLVFEFKDTDIAFVNYRIKNENINGDILQIIAEIQPNNAVETGLKIRLSENEQTLVGYEVQNKMLFVDRSRSGKIDFHDAFPSRSSAPLKQINESIKLNIFVDVSSVEVFGNDGIVAVTNLIYPSNKSTGIELFPEEGDVKIKSLQIWNLK